MLHLHERARKREPRDVCRVLSSASGVVALREDPIMEAPSKRDGLLVVELGGDEGRLALVNHSSCCESGVALVERNSCPPLDDLLSAP